MLLLLLGNFLFAVFPYFACFLFKPYFTQKPQHPVFLFLSSVHLTRHCLLYLIPEAQLTASLKGAMWYMPGIQQIGVDSVKWERVLKCFYNYFAYQIFVYERSFINNLICRILWLQFILDLFITLANVASSFFLWSYSWEKSSTK